MNQEELKAKIRGCTDCPLSSNRKLGVPGHADNQPSTVAVVSEAPGPDESEFGLPFVGQAGQYLRTHMEEMGFTGVLFTNMVRCPAYGPTPPEAIAECDKWLKAELDVYKPMVVILMGASAIKSVFGKGTVGSLRGRWTVKAETIFTSTYNPAAVLRNPSYEADFLSDLAMAKQILDELNR